MTACIYYSKNWSQRMVRYPSTTGWSDNHSGVLCSIPIHPLVITDDWRRITRTLLGIKIGLVDGRVPTISSALHILELAIASSTSLMFTIG